MKKSEHLFYLIKSLTRSEKRYFKLFCQNNQASTNYLLLFNLLDKMEAYNEEALQKQLTGQTFARQLHVTKNYLHKLILKSLRNFHSSDTPYATLRDLLRNIELLYNKELYSHCHYEIRQAEKVAEAHEDLHARLELFDWKRKIYQRWKPQDPSLTKSLPQPIEDTLEQLKEINELWELNLNFRNYQPTRMDQLHNHPRVRSETPPESIKGQVYYYLLLYNLKVSERELPDAEQALLDLIHILEANPLSIKNDPATYLSVLNNLTGFYFFTKDYQRVQANLHKTKQAPEQIGFNLGKVAIKSMLRTYTMELEWYRDNKFSEEGKAIIASVDIFVEQHKEIIPPNYILIFWYQFAGILFQSGAYSEALTWVNKILNDRFPGVREDLQRYARLLNLILHFELNNFMVLRYFIDGFRRQYHRKGSPPAFEKALLRHLARTSRLPRSEFKGAFRKLEEHWFSPGQEKVDHHILDYLDLRLWIKNYL